MTAAMLLLLAAACQLGTTNSIQQRSTTTTAWTRSFIPPPRFQTGTSTALHCIDTDVSPIPPSEGEQFWRTPNPTIVPKKRELFSVKPELITFDAVGTLITPSQSIGRWYREALNTVCEMQIRLPRPALFTAAFNNAYADMSKRHPCFGATSAEKMTSMQWWYEVVRDTYKNTENLTTIDDEEMETLLPEVFRMLYKEIFSTSKGWLVKEDAEYTLIKLREWREQGGGPKIGVISNFDKRLGPILKDLGLAEHLDFVLTSEQCKSEKPDRGIFDQALQVAKASGPEVAFHVGDSIELDVVGATSAGWTALRYNEWFDQDFPDWYAVDTPGTAELGSYRRQELMYWGRTDTARNLDWVEIWGLDDVLTLFGFPEDEDKPIDTTYVRAYRDD